MEHNNSVLFYTPPLSTIVAPAKDGGQPIAFAMETSWQTNGILVYNPHMTHILYFAYGSNMLTERLTARCSSARPIGVAHAPHHALEFSKKGKDGSGKATLVQRQNNHQHGVLFQISRAELSTLDAIEGVGVGYERHDNFPVTSASNGERLLANTYLATNPKEGLIPFDWYLALVIAGAQQHDLPANQLEIFQQSPHLVDAMTNRQGRLDALKALRSSGTINLS